MYSINQSQGGDRWQILVNSVVKLRVILNVGSFLTSWGPVSYWGRFCSVELVSCKNVDLERKREWLKAEREMFYLRTLVLFRRVRQIWKATIRFFCLSVRPHGKLGSHWTDFREIWYWSIFRNSVDKSAGLVKIWQEQRVTYILFLTVSHSVRLRTRNIKDRICEENHYIQLVFSNFFSPKIVPFMR